MQLFKGINVVSISVKDLNVARDFYANKLGFGEPLFDMPEMDWIEFGTGGAGDISVTTAEEGWQPGTGITVVLTTDDAHKACAELRVRGVRCDDPVGIPGVVTYCSFYDPFGNRLQMAGPPPAG